MTIHQNRDTYAIWLMPNIIDQNYLIDIVANLSESYKSFSFEPHCTLLSGIILSRTRIENYIEVNTRNISKIILKTVKIDYSNFLQKSLFIEFEISDELSILYDSFSKSLKPNKVRIFKPHLSILYETIPTEEKIQIINSIRLKESISFDKLAGIFS